LKYEYKVRLPVTEKLIPLESET